MIGMLIGVISQTPWFAIGFVPLAILYTLISRYFRNVSRELKRLDSISRYG